MIDSLSQENKVFVFMKGTPDAPMCGFSNTVCRILDAYGVKYSSANVLADPDLREGIKTFTKVCPCTHRHLLPRAVEGVAQRRPLRLPRPSARPLPLCPQWPTIPQVFVDGEFVGGSDILLSMHNSGELPKTFGMTDKDGN